MFQTQLRFVQIILTFSIFAGLLLRNTPLLIAALVGLVLVWQLEMLTGQLRIDTNEYLLTVIFIGLTFFPVIFSEVEILESVINLFYILLLVLSLVMVLFQDLSISKIGNTVFSTIFSFTIVSFIMSEVFFENLNHISKDIIKSLKKDYNKSLIL